MALPALIPRTVLFGNPTKADPRLSPDGTWLSFLAPVDGVLNVWVGRVGADEFRPVTADQDRGVRVYFWAHDGEHILYLQDVGGDENWRLHKVRFRSGAVTDLTPHEGVQVQIVAHDKRRPAELLIAMNLEDQRLHDVYRVDLRTDAVELAAKNPGTVIGWVADGDLVVRGALASTESGGTELLVRGGPDCEWERQLAWSAEDGLSSWPLGFTRDGTALHLADSRNANAARLVRFSLADGGVTVLAEDPQYDVSGAVIHPDTYEPQMVAFTRPRREWEVLDGSVTHDVARIRALNPGDFDLHARTHADSHWIVEFLEDQRPVSYWLYDRASGRGEFLFHTRPDLAEYTLAQMRPMAFVSRDGLTVHGYLTTPAGIEPRRLPLVLNVHGGPWHRDTWGYDPEAQWLANRGYACLQVNFRGSTGYGKAFLNAGNKEWGRRMHDDLVDAVRWAAATGVADPERVAIYGGSYGGYAALVGATFTPDLFRCAVDIVGPSSLLTFIETIPPY